MSILNFNKMLRIHSVYFKHLKFFLKMHKDVGCAKELSGIFVMHTYHIL